ncbi:hypothetical protein [Streptomyces shenzhenensis]|uniref:hypothetical protein n=1 Tax=Streptomyces shenzhenensis TaxID=943815 RepID=UPI00217ED44D|nr:hypothetical protein [Streptomyces shenzhenensis]
MKTTPPCRAPIRPANWAWASASARRGSWARGRLLEELPKKFVRCGRIASATRAVALQSR